MPEKRKPLTEEQKERRRIPPDQRKRRPPLSIGEKIQILKRFREGATNQMIAAEMGVYYGSVSFFLCECGVVSKERSRALRSQITNQMLQDRVKRQREAKESYIARSGWAGTGASYIHAAIMNLLIRSKGLTLKETVSRLGMDLDSVEQGLIELRKAGWVASIRNKGSGVGRGRIPYTHYPTLKAISMWRPIENDQG